MYLSFPIFTYIADNVQIWIDLELNSIVDVMDKETLKRKINNQMSPIRIEIPSIYKLYQTLNIKYLNISEFVMINL